MSDDKRIAAELSASERIRDFDGADAARQQEAEKDDAIRRERRARFFKRLLTDADGREWVWSLLSRFHAFDVVHAAGPTGFPDPQATAHYGGLHAAGWAIWCELDDAEPDLCSLMRREHR